MDRDERTGGIFESIKKRVVGFGLDKCISEEHISPYYMFTTRTNANATRFTMALVSLTSWYLPLRLHRPSILRRWAR